MICTFFFSLKLPYNERKNGGHIMRFRKAPKRIVELSPAEVRLLRYALMQFRNKVLSAGKPTEDIDEMLIKVTR